MSLWCGIDLGTLKPATAIVDCSTTRPALVDLHVPIYTYKKHGNAMKRVILWQRELTDFLYPYRELLCGAGIEYASGVHWGKTRDKATKHVTNQALISALFAAEHACATCGVHTQQFAPATIGKSIGLRQIRGLDEVKRRKERKRQTVHAVRMLVNNVPENIDDNAADAIAVALTMARKNPDWRAITKERMEA